MAQNLRQLETDLGQQVEDKLAQALGYREYEVKIGETLLDPRPEVIEIDTKDLSEAQITKYLSALGVGAKLPSAMYQILVSRNVSEDLVRSRLSWTITRSDRASVCKLVGLTVTDTRFKAILAVLKSQVNI
jgi:hypothetical protein